METEAEAGGHEPGNTGSPDAGRGREDPLPEPQREGGPATPRLWTLASRSVRMSPVVSSQPGSSWGLKAASERQCREEAPSWLVF